MLQGELRVAVAFIDLLGSTSWSAQQTAAEHAAALAVFEHNAHDLAVSHGARLVKLIGDEAMIVAADPSSACQAAVELCAATAREASLPKARGAVGYGSVTARAGDYFGPLVNLVARAVKEAPAGLIVATADVAAHLDPTFWTRRLMGPRHLRGFREPVDLWLIASTEGPDQPPT